MNVLLTSSELHLHFEQHGLPIFLLSGKHGTGKTTAVRAAIYRFLHLGLKILVSCPTGFLASTYKSEFGDSIVADTLHSSFNISVDPQHPPSMNWQLINYHVIAIDEISKISLRHRDHVFESLNSLPVFLLLILCGDKFQLQPFQAIEENTQTLPSFFQNNFFLSKASTFLLTEQYRCCDPKLHSFLCLIRHSNVTNKQILKHLSHICYTIEPEQIGAETIQHAYDTNPDTTFLTYTRNTFTHINQTLAKHIFGDVVPPTHVSLSSDPDLLQPIYKDMKVLLTENRDKEKGVINGTLGIIHDMYNQTIFVRSNNTLIPVFPTTNDKKQTYYPFTHGYSTTICKAQGQTLSHISLHFVVPHLPMGCAYVAMSRVSSFSKMKFLALPLSSHFNPRN